jgi:hypothetical protein
MHMQPLTEDERMLLTRNTMEVLDDWALQTREMMALLDMPETVKVRNFARFREDTPFPDDPRVLKRIHYLLRIADALRTTYPTNPQMRTRWVRQANSRFGRRTPLAMMLDGESGLVAVLAHLDCTYAWDLTGSKG